jgi:hypothetical protein
MHSLRLKRFKPSGIDAFPKSRVIPFSIEAFVCDPASLVFHSRDNGLVIPHTAAPSPDDGDRLWFHRSETVLIQVLEEIRDVLLRSQPVLNHPPRLVFQRQNERLVEPE